MINDVNSEDFQSFVKSAKFVVIDFWASWCGPCRQMYRVFDELAKEYTDNSTVAFGKLKIDDCQDIASQFNVRTLPTFIIFKDGEVLDTLVGANVKPRLQAWVDKNILL